MDTTTSKINERLLREYDQAEAITGAKIAKTGDGYVLVVTVAWKVGPLVVYNQRGKPRAWASMDRLLSYLSEMVPSVKTFELVLENVLQLPDEPAPAKTAAAPAPKARPAKKVAAKTAPKSASKAKPAGKVGRKVAHA